MNERAREEEWGNDNGTGGSQHMLDVGVIVDFWIRHFHASEADGLPIRDQVSPIRQQHLASRGTESY